LIQFMILRAITGEPLEPEETEAPNAECEPELMSNDESAPASAIRGDLDLDEETRKCNAVLKSGKPDPDEYAEPFVSRKQAVLAILADFQLLTAILAPFLFYVGIKSLRRLFERSKRKNEQFHSIFGCLSVIPNFFNKIVICFT